VSDPRRRALVPERLLLPPPPREPDLRTRWDALPFERRRELALASQRGGGPGGAHDPRGADELRGEEARLVRELAAVRVATAWRLQVAAVVLGWLVLMTLWGFGRSTYPDHERWWLAGGLAAGCVAWAAAARAARGRIRRARDVAARSLGADGAGPRGDGA
jgi:hypothetical protein